MGLTVAEANVLLDSVQTEADLRNIIAQLDTSTHGDITVLYSGSFNSIDTHTMDAISQLKTDPNLRILYNTQAFAFMDVMDRDSPTYNAKLYNTLVRVFGNDPRDWENNTTANQFLFGAKDADGNRIPDGAFDIVSDNFAKSATGNVIALVPFANSGQVFGASELPALLENSGVTHINGVPKSEVIDAFQRDSLIGAFNIVKNASYQQLAATGMISSIKINGNLQLQNLDEFLNEAQDLRAYYENHPEAQQRFVDYSNYLRETKPALYAEITSLTDELRVNGVSVDPVTGSRILNKIGIIGTIASLLLITGQASAAELSGDHEGAKNIIKDWAIDASGSLVGELIGGAVAGIVGTALVAGGVISAPVSGALILAGALIGGIYGGDAAKDLYELTKDKDGDGKRDLYNRIINLMYGATEFKITDPLVANINGGTQYTLEANFTRDEIVQQAKENMAWRYALFALNPFVITDIDYSRHNTNSNLDLYNPDTGKGMTEQYLKAA